MNIFAIHNNYPNTDNNPANTSLLIKEPVVYTLTDTALTRDGRPFFIPDYASPCTFQMSLVVRICRLGRSISPRFAHRYYDAMTVGVMFTAQNILEQCRQYSLPWELAKGFDGAAAIGRFNSQSEEYHENRPVHFYLKQNDVIVQEGNSSEAIFSPTLLISYISRFYTLRQGDLLYTGFPCKANTAKENTHLAAYIDNTEVLSFNVK